MSFAKKLSLLVLPKTSLALMYYRGDGTQSNYSKSLYWAKQAAKSKNLTASVRYQYLLKNPNV